MLGFDEVISIREQLREIITGGSGKTEHKEIDHISHRKVAAHALIAPLPHRNHLYKICGSCMSDWGNLNLLKVGFPRDGQAI